MTGESISSQLRTELEHLRDGVTSSITLGRARAVEDGMEIYEELFTAVLEVAVQLEASAPRITGSDPLVFARIGPNDSEIHWVQQDYVEIIETAAAAGHRAILLKLLYFPITLSRIALSSDAAGSAGSILGLLAFAYKVVAIIDDGELRGYAIQRIRFELEEFTNYYLVRELEKSNDAKLAYWIDALVGVFSVYSRLLKQAFDLRHNKGTSLEQQATDFKRIAQSLRDSYSRLQEHIYDLDRSIWYAEAELERAASETERQANAYALEAARSRVVAWQRIQAYQDAALVGVTAWILNEHLLHRIDASEAETWVVGGARSSSASEAWRMFRDSLTAEGTFGWSWWLTERNLEDRRAWSGYGYPMSRLLGLWVVLEMMRHANPETGDAGPLLPVDDETSHLIGDSGELATLIDTIVAEPSEWAGIVGVDVSARGSIVRRWLDTAHRAHEAELEEQLFATPISPSRVERLRQEIDKAWQRHSSLRSILVRGRGSTEEPAEALAEGAIGGTWWLSKGGFTDDERVSIGGVDSDVAMELVRYEDQVAFDRLIEVFEVAGSASGDEVSDLVLEVCRALEGDLYAPAVFLPGFPAYLSVMSRQPEFRYTSEASVGDLIATLAGYPVFRTNARESDHIVIADLPRAIDWVQGRFTGEGASESGFLKVSVVDFDQAAARSWIADHPEARFPPEVVTEDEKVRLLQKQVQLTVSEAFAPRVVDRDAGRKISVLLGDLGSHD
jgi:hypothetical protein